MKNGKVPKNFRVLKVGEVLRQGDQMFDGERWRYLSGITVVGCPTVLKGERLIRKKETCN